MLKLSIPTLLRESKYVGQVAFGTQELPCDGREAVCQKWAGIMNLKENIAFTCVNDGVYGSDFMAGELRISLLRSPSYSGHPISDRTIVTQDRFIPRIDQGERLFTFWFNGGALKERLENIDHEAAMHSEKPFPLSFFPSGKGEKALPLIKISDVGVQMSTFKRSEDNKDYIIRLFECTGNFRTAEILIPYLQIKQKITFGKFEIKTYRLSEEDKTLTEVTLMEW